MGKRSVFRFKGVLLAVALASVALLIPATSPAAVYTTCGGTHYGDDSCNFTPIGLGISIFGTNNLSGGYGSIYVLVKDAIGNTIASCSGSGECFAQHGILGAFSAVELPIPVGPLLCEVHSSDNGYYGCFSFVA